MVLAPQLKAFSKQLVLRKWSLSSFERPLQHLTNSASKLLGLKIITCCRQSHSVKRIWTYQCGVESAECQQGGLHFHYKGLFSLFWHSLGRSLLDCLAGIEGSEVWYSAQPIDVIALKGLYSSIFPGENGAKEKPLLCERAFSFNSS